MCSLKNTIYVNNVNELPSPPAKPNIQIVPINEEFRAKYPDFKDGWQKYFAGSGKPVHEEFINPRIGRVVHSVVLINGIPKYDIMFQHDGPIQEDGKSTPGAVLVPIEYKDRRYYVHCFYEYRAAIGEGEWVLSVPGGFSKLGASVLDTAKTEALEEAGIHIMCAEFGYSSSNRAFVNTKTGSGYAMFTKKETANPELAETIVGSFAIPIENFPYTSDKHINDAIYFAIKQLMLIIK